MNKLVLIGNGFDLAHGLKTSYSDFLLWYLNEAFKSLNRIKSSNSIATHEDKLILLTPIIRSSGYSILESLADFNKFINNNHITLKIKNDFAKAIIYQTTNNKWVDIESLYYSSLIKIYKKQKTSGTFLTTNEIVDLNESFTFMKSKLKEYLGAFKIKPTINEEIKQHLVQELINDQKAVIDCNTLFLNFNYTDTIELYKDSLPNSNFSEVNYIHGNLKDESNPIIFGYGDEMDTYYEKIEQLNNNEYTKNIKSFDYLKTSNYQNFSRFIDSSPFDVYIMGHSCGLSDRILLNSIFEHKNCVKIKIFYYQKTKDENDFFEKTQEISRHFRPINKGRMRKIIVPYEDCVPLTIFKS
ncbi:MAG: AbiH family protein [Bacteroidia bacterium]|nr:AbiH family protein [Bacteroidia bacterium]